MTGGGQEPAPLLRRPTCMPVDLLPGRSLVTSVCAVMLLNGCASTRPMGSNTQTPGGDQPPSSVSTSSVTQRAPGGTITGHYVVRPAPHAPAHGLGHRVIDLFSSTSRSDANPGNDHPVSTTLTRPDGRFRFTDVAAGTWIVATQDTAPPWHAESRQIQVTSTAGTQVRLVACYECAPR